MVGEWKPDMSRDVYQKSASSPPPYPSHHACHRWAKRGGCTAMTLLDAWHYSHPVNVDGDGEIVEGRLFSPSGVVMLAVTDRAGKKVIKTVKYMDWLEDEGKRVTIDHLKSCPSCTYLYNENEEFDGCRWCENPAVRAPRSESVSE